MDTLKAFLPLIGASTGLLALIISLCNWRRASHDPDRFDIATEITSLITRLQQCELSIHRNLTGCGAEDRATLHHNERWVTDDLCKLLADIGGTEDLVNKVRMWSRLMTSDPFPLTNKKNKLQPADARIIRQSEASSELVRDLKALRLKALKRQLCRKYPRWFFI